LTSVNQHGELIRTVALTVWSSWGWGTRSEVGPDHWSPSCSWLFQSQN